MVSQLYGTPLGLLVLIGGGIVWGFVSKGSTKPDPDARRPGESLTGWWVRPKLGRGAYYNCVFYVAIFVVSVTLGLIGGDFRMVGLGLLGTVLSVGVLLKRWGGRRPPT